MKDVHAPRRLPIVEHEGKRWFFDERLEQIRNVENPHDYQDLDEAGITFYRALVEQHGADAA